MPRRRSQQNPLPPPISLHEPFLRRAADPDGATPDGHALGGFLTMRLVDQLEPGRDPSPEALAYQTRATREFLAQLQPRTTEGNHLLEIVGVVGAASRDGSARLLWPPLLAFGYWLEQELRYEEALDVVDTAMRLAADGAYDEQVAAGLQRARLLRRLGRHDEARETYIRAGVAAERVGDVHSELLSRIGRAIVAQRVGNLPEAEHLLRDVIAAARARGDRDAEARACHDLANTCELQGRPIDGVPLALRAHELYESPHKRLLALSDLGLLMKTLGHYQAAEDAFTVVVSSDTSPEVFLTAGLELMEVAALRGDRLAFERWRRATEGRLTPSPYLAVDFELKAGLGFARFGETARAADLLRSARRRAEQHKLNQLAFRAEAALRDLEGGQSDTPTPIQESPARADAIEVASVRLRELRAAT